MADLGYRGMNGKIRFFNGQVWMFWMRARFGWNPDEGPRDNDADELEFYDDDTEDPGEE